MKILVANLGSTSFKYRLFNLTDQPGVGGKRELARGGVERIGAASSRVYATLGDEKFDSIQNVPDHAAALEAALGQLSSERGPLQAIEEVAAIGFKAVHGGRVTGVVRVSSEVLDAMEEVSA
ncbi:MAG: acetate/propionate family kinase, partial [Pirellulales bacterium]|nr:acetate/propionate family kinase [Pirellulales bacterium]